MGKGVFQADKGATNAMKWVGKIAKHSPENAQLQQSSEAK